MTVYTFDGYLFDANGETLTREGHTTHLRPQTARLLAFLLENRQVVISKGMLAEHVWDDAVVNDQAIFQCINQLRKALHENSRRPRYLKTVPRQGYQWIFDPVHGQLQSSAMSSLPLAAVPPAVTAAATESSESSATADPTLRRWWLGLAALALVLIVAIWGLLSRRQTTAATRLADTKTADHVRVAVCPFENRTAETNKQWLELGLMDMVIRQLQQRPGLEPVATERMLKAISDLQIPRGQTLAREQLTRLGKTMGTDWVVSVSVALDPTGTAYVMHVRALDRNNRLYERRLQGRVIAEMGARVSHTIAAIFKGQDLHQRLQALSDNAFVNEAYAQGIQALHQGEDLRAETFFRLCINEDPQFIWAAYHLAGSLWALGEIDAALALIQETSTAAKRKGDIALKAELQTLLGDVFEERGLLNEAEVAYRESLRLWRSLGDREGEMAAFLDIGFCLEQDGQIVQAAQCYAQARNLAEQNGDHLGVASVLNMAALSAMQQGEDERALALLTETLQAYRDLKSPINEGYVLMNMGTACFFMDRYQQAINAYRGAQEIFSKHKLLLGQAQVATALGEFYVYHKEWSAARRELERALALVQELGNPRDAFDIYLALAEMASRTGHESHALQHAEAMKRIADRLAIPDLKLEWSAFLAFHHLRWQQAESAKSYLYQILADQPDSPVALLLLARQAYALGDYKGAYDYQTQVKQTFPEVWDGEEERLLVVYSQAADAGQAVKLPPH